MGLNESRRLHCKEFTITEFRTEPDGTGQQADDGLLGDNNMRLSLAVRDIPNKSIEFHIFFYFPQLHVF